MTMSIRPMTLGAGYRYLMSSVARADEGHSAAALTAYYAASGTPPGRFLGSGLAGLNDGAGVRVGATVSEEQLWRMLGMLQDPLTGSQLGRSPTGGRQYADGRRSAGAKAAPVAAFDLTFSAPKSVSVAWGLADDATRATIHAAHVQALQDVIAYAEQHVFATRRGKGGAICEDVRGAVAVAFDHWDSRAGDPQLHTHVVVLNRVQAVSDGAWRTLDSKTLFRWSVGLSEMYNAVLSDHLTARLGWSWTECRRRHSDVPKWEVAGVGERLREEFSSRTSQIEAAKEVLVQRFVEDHERQPTAREVLQMRQQATLQTRPDKHLHALPELVHGWRARAFPHVGPEPVAWASTLAGRNELPLLQAGDLVDGMLTDAATVAIANVSGRRATFTRANVFAEVLRLFHGVRFAAADDRMTVVERTTDFALERSLRITPEDVCPLLDWLRRPDGTTKLRPRESERYTTQELLDAETRLLEASRTLDGPRVPAGIAYAARTAADGFGQRLSADQAAAVEAVVSSGRVVDVIVGAAGTGKSTAMRGVRTAWEAEFGPGSVIGLAPSAAAADVLAEAVGVQTENTAKWLVERARQPERAARLAGLRQQLYRASPSHHTRALTAQARKLAAEYEQYDVTPGRLVIIDEASMVGTLELDALVAQARDANAKVLLVGDWAQLAPVSAGGAFHLLATDRDGAPQLHDVRRFRHEWERDASLALRRGDPHVASTYAENDRVRGGDRESMLDLLYEAWRNDIRAGRSSLMIAADQESVRDLNQRARTDRVATREVALEGVALGDGTQASVGDIVVTRHNQRTVASGPSWVKNGDRWRVVGVRSEGSLEVRGLRKGNGSAVLPGWYVAQHVELGYATTAHRAQGRTVDTAHAFISPTLAREPLYVMATRGRETNHLYVDCSYDTDPHTSHQPLKLDDAFDVLCRVLERTEESQSATSAVHAARRHEVRPPSVRDCRVKRQGLGKVVVWGCDLGFRV
jgi:conjugative relaxase-like TrwC/TraI family protein